MWASVKSSLSTLLRKDSNDKCPSLKGWGNHRTHGTSWYCNYGKRISGLQLFLSLFYALEIMLLISIAGVFSQLFLIKLHLACKTAKLKILNTRTAFTTYLCFPSPVIQCFFMEFESFYLKLLV